MKDELTGEQLGADVNGWVSQPDVAPFSSECIEFLDAVSRALRQRARSAADPNARAPVTALAYWLRRASQRRALQGARRGIARPCGRIFHVAPGNVEVMFAYSWAAGVITGNANIIRLPSIRTGTTDIVLAAIQEASQGDAGAPFQGAHVFVSYPSSEMQQTAAISRTSDVRMIWGGDQTISSIRALPSKPDTRDIGFMNKESLTLLRSAGLKQMGESEWGRLIEGFVADAWTFRQMACSSPRAVIWVGAPGAVQERFWEDVSEASRGEDTPPVAMNRLVEAFETAARGVGTPSLLRGLTRVWIDELRAARDGVGGGFFYELQIDELDELRGALTRHHQTIGHAGFESIEELEAAARSGALDVDRIVPVGSALDFGYRWDGYDLLGQLVRIIHIT